VAVKVIANKTAIGNITKWTSGGGQPSSMGRPEFGPIPTVRQAGWLAGRLP
jgi:hypothetical protein